MKMKYGPLSLYVFVAVSLAISAPAAAQTPPSVPADGAAFAAWCGDAGHFAQCRQAVLEVNAPKYLRKVAGYPGCAIMVQDKTSLDHAVQRLLAWMAAHVAPAGVSRDAAITEALNRSLALC
jgi:hypothetical protein